MFGKPKEKPRIGATAKRMQAEMISRKRRGEDVKGHAGKQSVSGPVTLIFLLSVGMAFLMTEQGVYDRYAHMFRITKQPMIDQFITGPGVPHITGTVMADMFLVSITRGLFLFLLAGVVPYLVYLWAKMTDRMQGNLYVMHWGCIISLPFTLYVLLGFIFPLLKEIYDIFFY
ncbi:MAG: hypothetical protein EA357_11480 [Micavibrio sp.]|nr:MAG: hypothetical protein EA357_11480 [Micavibrio sp.]